VRKLAAVSPLLIVIAVWQVLASASPEFSYYYASPALIVRAAWLQLTDGRLISEYNIYRSFVVTTGEAASGLVLGCLLGSVIGLGLWYSSRAADISRPYLDLIGAVPVFALAPLMILWFGTGFGAKVAMATFSTILVAIQQAYEGAQNVEGELLDLVTIMGGSRMDALFKIVVPSSLIWVLASVRLNVGFAIIGAFLGEWISSEVGLGHMILRASGVYDVPVVLVGILCIMLLASALMALVRLLEARLLNWRAIASSVAAIDAVKRPG
jgi:NitT/TauT family transport system permease protein